MFVEFKNLAKNCNINKGDTVLLVSDITKLIILYKDKIIDEHDLLAFENVKKLNIFSRLIRSINYLIWGDV